ncbi:2OG-Fe-II oxygenase family oxidoreductase [Trametes versicolor FP-101664 SS1]|uniref:2OG-Fe-II oxygenase family oxidoreductase n=1 Tax=Trametes versicolor (strain FP-101664) TaxID=717944 RepID=UPI00046225EB|nr:2OG-Fe-II oxygenase family oxidoreductase [Trametes versicolor FP-101664 SS1]EIW65088.1 2OG-Fe-II oxygenase family oxidoreductase [Trametes versicolor FP-101664 SS1]
MSATTTTAVASNAAWPAFPGGKEVTVAPLATVDLGRLLAKDAAEVAKLLDVCKTHGFFYLDLQTCEPGRQILEAEQGVLRFMERFFGQPLDVKMLEDRKSHTHGFKPVGTFSGTKNGSRDCYETLKVSRAEMVEKSPKLPEDVKKQEQLFDTFISLSQLITQTLLERLSDALGLAGPARLEQFHRDGEDTNTTLVMLHYPPSDSDDTIGHNKHTDIGSITLLFSEQWGLQVWSPETDSWAFIQPRPHGHATINVGDSLRFLSQKQLYSCLHRVIPPVGGRQSEDRYSIAYFLRPENNAVYEDPNGKKVTAREWHDNKYVMFGEPHVKQEASPMLTGGMEPILGSRTVEVA